jgi:hypothetical protein
MLLEDFIVEFLQTNGKNLACHGPIADWVM